MVMLLQSKISPKYDLPIRLSIEMTMAFHWKDVGIALECRHRSNGMPRGMHQRDRLTFS